MSTDPSPMPFGCVAFEAGTGRADRHRDASGGLQCLSAVWPLRPLHLRAGCTLHVQLSPMPFGCVAFEAFTAHHHCTSNAFQCLQCLSAVWPLRPTKLKEKGKDEEYGLQCLSAVWPLRPCLKHEDYESLSNLSPMPFGCVAFEALFIMSNATQNKSKVSNAFRLCGL